MKKYIKKTVFILSIILFTLILFLVLFNKTMFIDDNIYNIVLKSIDPISNIIIFITNLSGVITLITICIATILLYKNKTVGYIMSLNLIIVTFINQLVKHLVSRQRPIGINKIIETGYSFPSAHSMASFAFYGFIIYLVYKYVKSKRLKTIYIFCLSLLILLIGISRIYLGVHFATDVIGGYMLSLAYLIIFLSIINKKGII